MTQASDELNQYIIKQATVFSDIRELPSVFQSRDQIYKKFQNEPGPSYGIEYWYDRTPATQCVPAKYVAARAFGVLTTTDKDLLHHGNQCRTGAKVMTVAGSNGWAIFDTNCNPMVVPICERKKHKFKKEWKGRKGDDLEGEQRKVSAAIDSAIDKKLVENRKDFVAYLYKQEKFNELVENLSIEMQASSKDIKTQYQSRITNTSAGEEVVLNNPFNRIEQAKDYHKKIDRLGEDIKFASDMIKEDLKNNPEKLSRFESLIEKVQSREANLDNLLPSYCAVYCANKYAMFSSKGYREVMTGDNNMKALSGELGNFLEVDIVCDC